VTSSQHHSRPEPQPSDADPASVAFFEHSLDGVLFTAPDGRILDANAAACGLLERSKEEICTLGRAGLADPNDPRWLAGVAERRRTGRFAGPLTFLRGDGSPIELNITSGIFADDNGDLRTVVVMRAVDSDGAAPADRSDPGLVDASGVSNRRAFVHLAEQQCHNGARERLALGFLYIRLERVDDQGAATALSTSDRREFARLLEADRQWGDVIGRVGDDDYAVLVRNDTGDVIALINAMHARLEAHRRLTHTPFRVHVGVNTFVPDVRTNIDAMIESAAMLMAEHAGSERAHDEHRARCLFALDGPGESVPQDVVVLEEQPGLTDRENAVLRLLASRRSYDEIAQALFVSVNTVKTHVSHVYAKLGVNSRKDAVEKARTIGLLTTRGQDPAGFAAHPGADAVDFGRIALVAEALTAAQDADEILDIIVMQGLAGLNADRALVALAVDDTLVPVASYGYTQKSINNFLPARLQSNLPLAVAVREQQIVWVSSPEDGIRRFPEMKNMWPLKPRAWINAPLVAKGHAYGGFAATFPTGHEFSQADRAYLRSLTNLAALALHNLHSRAVHA
jgi:PAS domain S-box-containing protein